MCFRHLPIEFDENGKARLMPAGWAGAAEPARQQSPNIDPDSTPLQHLHVAPVTRIAGAMDFYATIDIKKRRVVDARASAAAFRGYEVVLRGRPPLDAMDLSSRACGVCGGVHSSTSSMALDMALPVSPPPLGVLTRNIAQAAEFLYDHALHMCLLAGPDYSEQLVQKTTPGLWKEAERAPAPGSAVHGFKTVGQIMRALNPLEGELYLSTFAQARIPMRIVQTMVGNYPHPVTLVPGGISVLMDEEKLRSVEKDLMAIVDWLKRLIHVYSDLMSFMRERRPDQYERVGERPANLICFGRYDDITEYDGQFATMDAWGSARAIPPGVVIDGELRTSALSTINLGIEEFVDHAFYETWSGQEMPVDPAGRPLSPFHPWNKETRPKPEGRNWQERYTWATAPRWDREVVEAGPIARNWMLALSGRTDSVIEADGHSLRFVLPKGESLPEMTFQWRRPARVNAMERNLARATSLGFTWLQAMGDVHRSIELLRRGERKVWNRSVVPARGIGVGLWEAARGALAHWITIENQVVKNYQIVTPSSFNASPRDPWGNAGPYEEAAMNTPILEECSDDSDFHGIDIMRAIRSFDPCMPCAVHMYAGQRTITRDVTSCACGDE